MKINDIKQEKCFAWFPELMDGGKTVWLNYYTKVYRYEEHERWIRFASRLRGQFYKTIDWNLIEKYQ